MKHTRNIICIITLMLMSVMLSEAFFLKETLFEGESQNYTSDGYSYEVKLVNVYDSVKKAVFEVNGESTGTLGNEESYRFDDGASIFIREVMPQNSGKDLVQYNFFPAEHDSNVSAAVPETVTEQIETPAIASGNETVPQDTVVDSKEDAADEEPAKAEPFVVSESAPQPVKQSWWEGFKSWIRGLFGRR